MFDTYKGYPHDGAINDVAPPHDGEDIVAGMWVKKNADGELIKATGAAGEIAHCIMETQGHANSRMSGVLAYIVSNAIILTDQYDDGANYNLEGERRLMVNAAAHGKITLHDGGASPVVGWHDGFLTRDNVDYLKVIVAI